MEELRKIQSELKGFPKEYFYRNSQAEENRQREHQAATTIQSWYRACKVNAYLSNLHKKAVIIQKIWRGFTARARFRQMVKAAYFIAKMNFYNEMAVRIQRRWRGFYVRKYVHNFYKRKRYLEGLLLKNELVRKELDEFEELQRRERDFLMMVNTQTAKRYQAQRLHHLISTKHCPGVFNSPYRETPHEMEQLLRQVKYQAPTRLVPRAGPGLQGSNGATAPQFPATPRSPQMRNTKASCSIRLPPIATRKHQGVFREPGEVWEQRVHCPNLTLGLQSSCSFLQDTQNQLGLHKGNRNVPRRLSHRSNSHPMARTSFNGLV